MSEEERAGQPEEGAGGDPPTTAEQAMESVEAAAGAVADAAAQIARSAAVELPELAGRGGGDAEAAAAQAGIGLLGDVALRVQVELGRTRMYVEDVLRLNADSIIELDKAAGDPVDIYVNNRHVARGEVLVLNENFCIRVSEIIQGAAADG